MRSRTIAIAGSIAALALAATPVAAVAATTQHAGAQATRTDQARDIRGVRHVDRTPDRSSTDRSADRSIDVRDR
jgi:putative N-acetylmannosamine-6-phosphate epimerase